MSTPYKDWSDLAGLRIEIRKDDEIIRTGLVDDVATSGTVLWMASHGAHLRMLFEKAEGYTAWSVPAAAPARSAERPRAGIASPWSEMRFVEPQ